jgi:RimJ/RimL family protein N-acetyltransferase
MLSSPRLRLRSWRDEDLPAFSALNADAEVMEHMPKCLTREESDAFAGRIQEGIDRLGFGLWAGNNRGFGRAQGLSGASPHQSPITSHF